MRTFTMVLIGTVIMQPVSVTPVFIHVHMYICHVKMCSYKQGYVERGICNTAHVPFSPSTIHTRDAYFPTLSCNEGERILEGENWEEAHGRRLGMEIQFKHVY